MKQTKPTGAKTSIKLPAGLWKRMRMQALDEGRDPAEIVSGLIESYLVTKAKKSARRDAEMIARLKELEYQRPEDEARGGAAMKEAERPRKKRATGKQGGR